MEKIPYQVIGIVCKTPCPHKHLHKHLGQSGNVAYVGSASCGECKNYGGQTKEHVICNSK